MQSNFFKIIRIHFVIRVNDFIAIEIIVLIFDVIARNIFLFMIDKLTNRNQFINIVKKNRYLFQQLLNFVVVVANLNFKFRSITFAKRKFVIFVQSIENKLNHENHMQVISKFQKIQKYTNDQRRSNVHITFHYETVMNEYEMFSNVNVLMRKNKHK